MKNVRVLVAVVGSNGLRQTASKLPEEEVFRFLSDYYEFVGETIVPAGGEVIKFMGDAALLLFPEEKVDVGVRALLKLQADSDDFVQRYNVSCRHHVRAHFGPVIVGELGTRDAKRKDIVGATVNTVFMMKPSDFSLTPEAFRSLQPETRRLFKKHTPPITYISLSASHRDAS